MLFEDTYLTIDHPVEGTFKDKGSRFIAYALPALSEEETKTHLIRVRKEHPAACHHCYAFLLGADKQSFRANDDGEPSGTAGKPILGQIRSKDLTNILIIVVRYFGGTLLGVSGLINAYRQAAADALSKAKIIERTVNDVYKISFDYLQMNDVMRVIKDAELEIVSQHHEQSCNLTFSVRKSRSVQIYDLFKKITGLEIEYVSTK